MTEKQLAKKFEELRKAYKAHWLVKDTQAFKDFCFPIVMLYLNF